MVSLTFDVGVWEGGVWSWKLRWRRRFISHIPLNHDDSSSLKDCSQHVMFGWALTLSTDCSKHFWQYIGLVSKKDRKNV